MFQREFVFGTGSAVKQESENCIQVSAAELYSPEKGYGFVTEENRREQDDLKFPELNSGFDTLYWYREENITEIQEDEERCFLDSDEILRRLEREDGELFPGEEFPGEKGRIPLIFRADVPGPGNYKVTVTFRGQEPCGEMLLFAECRRLGYKGATVFRCDMTVNVCDIVPRGTTVSGRRKAIDIATVADRPGFGSIRIQEISCPTLYIAGDSTVTDQSADYPYTPGTCYSGWGQMLPAYLDGRIAVSNHAHSGLTTDSFRSEGHYGIVQRFLCPGDFFFMQFGHNDQKLQELKAEEGYRANLLRYIEECREAGAYPVIVTPLARNSWKGSDGAYNDLLKEYAESCLKVGEEENVPVLDLHGRSMEFIRKKGLEAAKAYFHPGDFTHSNDYGAYLFAGMVADEIVRVCKEDSRSAYRFLAECVTGGFGSWPPAGEIVAPKKPKRYENRSNPLGEALLLAEVENLEEPADRVAVLDMLIKTAHFFPTNVYNDMFTDVVGHEWYAGTVECAYQNGIIDPELVEDGKFFPLQPVTLGEFLVFAVNGYRSRRALPEEHVKESESFCVYDGKCRDFMRPYVRAACALGLIATDGSEVLDRVITRGEAVEICRRLSI